MDTAIDPVSLACATAHHDEVIGFSANLDTQGIRRLNNEARQLEIRHTETHKRPPTLEAHLAVSRPRMGICGGFTRW